MGIRPTEVATIKTRALTAAASLALVAAACGYSGPSAATLLQRAKATFDHTSAFHIQLTSQNTTGSGLELTAAQGDAVRPDGFSGVLSIEESGFPLQVHVIASGGQFYVQLPFSADYSKANPAQYGFGNPGQLLDPNRGISTFLTEAEKPTLGSQTRLNGEELQQVNANLPGSLVKALLVDAEPSQPVATVFSIDTSDNQVREVDLTGPIFQAGQQSTFHLVLDKYGENVTVTPPSAP